MIIKCEHCQKKILLSRASDGQKIKCPHCAEQFILKEEGSGSRIKDSLASSSEDLKVVVDEPTSTRTLETGTVVLRDRWGRNVGFATKNQDGSYTIKTPYGKKVGTVKEQD